MLKVIFYSICFVIIIPNSFHLIIRFHIKGLESKCMGLAMLCNINALSEFMDMHLVTEGQN